MNSKFMGQSVHVKSTEPFPYEHFIHCLQWAFGYCCFFRIILLMDLTGILSWLEGPLIISPFPQQINTLQNSWNAVMRCHDAVLTRQIKYILILCTDGLASVASIVLVLHRNQSLPMSWSYSTEGERVSCKGWTLYLVQKLIPEGPDQRELY